MSRIGTIRQKLGGFAPQGATDSGGGSWTRDIRGASVRSAFRVGVLAFAAAVAASAAARPTFAAPIAPIVLGKERGRPTVELDRLDFPDMPGAPGHKKHLKRALARAAREADWGVGSGHKIEYRVEIRKLSLTREDGVLRVRCIAVGRLPGGKAATSQLNFGGDPNGATKLVRQVLEIVARGVVTRLAQLERRRRSAGSE